MFEVTYQELWWYTVLQPIIVTGIMLFAIGKIIAHRAKRYREKLEADRITIGTEVKMQTGEHEGRRGIVFGLVTVESENGTNTEAGVFVECGCTLLQQPLTNLEKIS